MKTLFNLRVLLCSIILVSVSCGGDNDPTPLVLKADFEAQVSEGGVVNFQDKSENATAYNWNFGDNTTSAEKNPSHTYATSGTYTVKLTATGADGKTAEKSSDIRVRVFGGPNLVKGASANGFDDAQWNELSFLENDATFNYDGALTFNGPVNASALIYQAIEVEANKPYQIMVDVAGSGLDQAMIGLFLTEDEPSDDNEPLIPDAYIQWNTICAKTANLSGDLAALQCKSGDQAADKGEVTFTNAGTIYFAIKVEVFGAWGSGITINEASLRLLK